MHMMYALAGMPPKFKKIVIPYILKYITHIFNTIIMTSQYSTEWKHVKIIPIPKSKDRNDLRTVV